MIIQLRDIEKFVELMIRKGFTRRSLAEAAKVGESTVISIANGGRNPSPKTAKLICEALEVEFDDIFEIVKTKKEPQVVGK